MYEEIKFMQCLQTFDPKSFVYLSYMKKMYG